MPHFALIGARQQEWLYQAQLKWILSSDRFEY
jgi:hypothetical protein